MTSSPDQAGPTASAVHSRSAALVLLLLLALVWGVHWVVVKQGLHYLPPLTYGAFRMLGGLLTMVAILGVQRRIKRPPRHDLPIIASVSLLQIAAGVLIMNFALQAVPAGRSSVLLYAMPLWVALLLWAFFRTPPRRNEAVGLVLGLGGILVLVNPTVIDWGVPLELAGTLALVVNGILWAAVTIHIRRHTWMSSPLDLQPWMLLTASVPVVAGRAPPGAGAGDPVGAAGDPRAALQRSARDRVRQLGEPVDHPLARPARVRDRLPRHAGGRAGERRRPAGRVAGAPGPCRVCARAGGHRDHVADPGNASAAARRHGGDGGVSLGASRRKRRAAASRQERPATRVRQRRPTPASSAPRSRTTPTGASGRTGRC